MQSTPEVANAAPIVERPIRLWPGVVLVALQWLVFLSPVVVPDAGIAAVLSTAVGGAAVAIWWLFFSRAPWAERVGVIVAMIAAVFAVKMIVHPSIATGMQGMMLGFFCLPVLTVALVGAVAATRRMSAGARRAAYAVSILLACAVMASVRTDGVRGDAVSEMHFRWTPTAEERLLAEAADEPLVAPSAAPATPPSAAPVEVAPEAPVPAPSTVTASAPPSLPPATRADRPAEWPGFRGPERDGIVRGVRIATDWSQSPPVELWRKPVGPGWSSFAVDGDRIFTQEQRGEDELVSAYDLATGRPVWRHRDAARFWESNAGAGPRATPTLAHGRVYTLGGTGILNALDARDGSVVWTKDAIKDTGGTVPLWGIAASPLVVGDVVIAAPNGWVGGYDAATGKRRWLAPRHGGSYSSPHLATIGGIVQAVLLNGSGATAVAPADGAVLWKHDWPNTGIVQPAVIEGGDVLLGCSSMSENAGLARVSVAQDGSAWKVTERWKSNGLKPYFNDFVVHEGHAFGFDGGILAAVDLADGARKWKGGRYGHGQLVLLPEQDLLLVLSEEGELALVNATPDQFTEIARFKAIEGKTWNHPVLVGDVLLVRNGEEMAAFRLRRETAVATLP